MCLYKIGVYLIKILFKVYPKTESKTTPPEEETEPMQYDDIRALLNDQEITDDQIDATEVKIMKYFDSKVFPVTYLDCLEFVFFDNCLWHRKFKALVNIGKSILIK